MSWLLQNWWILALGLVGLAYWLLQYMAYNKAKLIALKYLAVAHKIAVGSANVEVAALTKVAYDALPPSVKAFVPPIVFSTLVLQAYNEVVHLIGEAKQKAEKAQNNKKPSQ